MLLTCPKHVRNGALYLGGWEISAATDEVLDDSAADECFQMPMIFLIHQSLRLWKIKSSSLP